MKSARGNYDLGVFQTCSEPLDVDSDGTYQVSCGAEAASLRLLQPHWNWFTLCEVQIAIEEDFIGTSYQLNTAGNVVGIFNHARFKYCSTNPGNNWGFAKWHMHCDEASMGDYEKFLVGRFREGSKHYWELQDKVALRANGGKGGWCGDESDKSNPNSPNGRVIRCMYNHHGPANYPAFDKAVPHDRCPRLLNGDPWCHPWEDGKLFNGYPPHKIVNGVQGTGKLPRRFWTGFTFSSFARDPWIRHFAIQGKYTNFCRHTSPNGDHAIDCASGTDNPDHVNNDYKFTFVAPRGFHGVGMHDTGHAGVDVNKAKGIDPNYKPHDIYNSYTPFVGGKVKARAFEAWGHGKYKHPCPDNCRVGSKCTDSSCFAAVTTMRKGSTHGGHAWKAFDGRVETRYGSGSCTHTGNDKTHWWKVNLKTSFEIWTVKVSTRTDCCGARLNGFSVTLITPDETDDDHVCGSNIQIHGWHGNNGYRDIGCPGASASRGTDTQEVRIDLTHRWGQVLTICEVQLEAVSGPADFIEALPGPEAPPTMKYPTLQNLGLRWINMKDINAEGGATALAFMGKGFDVGCDWPDIGNNGCDGRTKRFAGHKSKLARSNPYVPRCEDSKKDGYHEWLQKELEEDVDRRDIFLNKKMTKNVQIMNLLTNPPSLKWENRQVGRGYQHGTVVAQKWVGETGYDSSFTADCGGADGGDLGSLSESQPGRGEEQYPGTENEWHFVAGFAIDGDPLFPDTDGVHWGHTHLASATEAKRDIYHCASPGGVNPGTSSIVPWWSVDLRWVFHILKIRVRAADPCYSGWLKNYQPIRGNGECKDWASGLSMGRNGVTTPDGTQMLAMTSEYPYGYPDAGNADNFVPCKEDEAKNWRMVPHRWTEVCCANNCGDPIAQGNGWTDWTQSTGGGRRRHSAQREAEENAHHWGWTGSKWGWSVKCKSCGDPHWKSGMGYTGTSTGSATHRVGTAKYGDYYDTRWVNGNANVGQRVMLRGGINNIYRLILCEVNVFGKETILDGSTFGASHYASVLGRATGGTLEGVGNRITSHTPPPRTQAPTQAPTPKPDRHWRWGRAGGWGGPCTCTVSGKVYYVGDNRNHCRSLACFGPGARSGWAGNEWKGCTRRGGKWSRMRVDCEQKPHR